MAHFISGRACFGNVVVALPPDRGRADDRRADYHDPSLPPRHALVAFGLWLRHRARRCAGPHGRAWHAGMASRQGRGADRVVLSRIGGRSTPGDLPVHRQQSGRSRASQAPHRARSPSVICRRRWRPSALSGEARELERLVDEYAQADGLDRKRRERLARLIIETAQRSGLAREAGVAARPRPRRSAAPDRRLAVRPQGSRDQGWPACIRPSQSSKSTARRGLGSERRGRARGAHRRARRPPDRAGPGRRPGARPARRAADRPQSLHRRPAHAAHADRAWISAGSPPTK